MRILYRILFASVLAAIAPTSGEAQQPCNQACAYIPPGGGHQGGMGCVILPQGQIGGFNCHADVNGCDIERTGCGETEEDALLSAEERTHVFGQGFIQTQMGTMHYALIPCALTRLPVFVVAAEALTTVDLGAVSVDR